jgi:hypothetical protein
MDFFPSFHELAWSLLLERLLLWLGFSLVVGLLPNGWLLKIMIIVVLGALAIASLLVTDYRLF